VALRDGLLRTGLLDRDGGLALTDAGRAAFTELGVLLPVAHRRPLLQDCLDWTERREHLGGAIPAAFLAHAIEAGWLERDRDRALRLGDTAAEPLALLGIQPYSLAAYAGP
jgi:hypothetical protein